MGGRAAMVGGAAGPGGVVGGAGGAVVTGVVILGLVSDFAGLSPIRSTAVTVPKPTRSAATHASGSKSARPPSLRDRCVVSASSAVSGDC
jgi:hypothetical protein